MKTTCPPVRELSKILFFISTGVTMADGTAFEPLKKANVGKAPDAPVPSILTVL
ncbi:MAG: hypothetical protein IPP48_15100 [Chitinophagaceae bacterium]|nr:hypothetical protein [Chitinophagaceae bacterium]